MKKPVNYQIQARNHRAVNLLRSWLRECGVVSSPSTLAGFDLAVKTTDGLQLEVQVAMREDETMMGHGIQVVSSNILGKNPQVALSTFHKVTVAAGYGRPQPLNRGAEPELNEKGNPRNLNYKDNEFDVAIRATMFRRSPNPPADRWAQYADTVKKTAYSFFRLNYELCIRNGMNFDDVMQHARCFVVSFCAYDETPNPVFHDNERLLYQYIRQHLKNDLGRVLQSKQRSVIPDLETVNIGLRGTPEADLEVSPDAEVGTDEVDVLEARLNSFGHDDLLSTLRAAADNEGFDNDIRVEARRRIREHGTVCPTCLAERKAAQKAARAAKEASAEIGLEVNE